VGSFKQASALTIRATFVNHQEFLTMKLSIAIHFAVALFCSTASRAGDEIKDCDVCPTLIVVPAGEFTMGSNIKESGHPDEKPEHTVKIAKPFAVGKFEVTFDQWDACTADGGCKQVSDDAPGRADRPIINVDWAAAKTYVAWLAKKTGKPYRLLSESEWEYAARGGTTKAWYWGSADNGYGGMRDACLFSNTHDQSSKQENRGFNWLEHPCDDGFVKTAPVGKFKPNPFGLYDMLGNVREWVEDCHGPYKDAPKDGSPAQSSDCELRVARGGAWMDGPSWTRSAYRIPASAKFANYAVGFRVARDLR
jgi:formylglycine-generating enzyme required for sulfatase activity